MRSAAPRKPVEFVAEWSVAAVPNYYEDDRTELYDLAADPSEQTDLSERHSQQLAELRNKLETWRTSVAAAAPNPNPAFRNAAPSLKRTGGR
jgi:hypothetical protein